ncbi:MAG: phenylalanine--tRNA ligase subunit beta [Rickettsiales bacterium]|jgi:phenylalanyl-tRNA synthetase beta chain|nr:phenylalanine--tRNA ligase subunit beta [Rickettsiales bacterium]
MRWTYNWLKEYLDTEADAKQVADALTKIGLEIEGLVFPVVPIAAKIVECSDIPETHLHLLKVDDGTGVLRQVVCGAPNARAGLTGALALPGCKVAGVEIKAGRIRGFESNGMMCSEKELEISDSHDGIIELEDTAPGTPLRAADDAVFEAKILPNRPDYLAVRGIALDLVAAGLGKFGDCVPTALSGAANRKAVIKSPARCLVYRLAEIDNIEIAPSCRLVADRLAAIGITPRNAPIDATNYVCYDLGQPMHCFDADEISGDIIIRDAEAGEKFADLFGKEHILAESDLVIADAAGILALAGIVGGSRGMTTDKTRNIILESACFEPVGIRKTARRLGLSTDASFRYERGIDPTITEKSLAACARIIVNACGGEIVGTFAAGENPADNRIVEYSPALMKQKTGVDMPASEQKAIIERFGFKVETKGDVWKIKPTPARIDITIPEAIVSDLIRIYGYDNIRVGGVKLADVNPSFQELNIKSFLAGRGLSEIRPYKFGDSKKEKLLGGRPSVMVVNPIIDTFDTARNSLVQGMLDTVADNDRWKRSNLNLFELGVVFDGNRPGDQHEQLIIARTGVFGENIGTKHGRLVEIYDVRADLLALFPGASVRNHANPPEWAHPFRAGEIVAAGAAVAEFAELHPAVAKKFGIKTRVVLGLVDDAAKIPAQPEARLVMNAENDPSNEFPDFPLITRDFAFITDDEAGLLAAVKDLAYEANVFDTFLMPDGKKSVAIELVVQPAANMTDAALAEFQNKVVAAAEKTGAKLRS